MKVTAAMANKKIKELSKKLDDLYVRMNRDKTYTLVPGMDEIIPDFDLSKTLAEITTLHFRIERIKHRINQFNAEHVVNIAGDPTIDVVLIRLATKNKLLRELEDLKNIPKKAIETGNMFNKSASQYCMANFDPAEAEEIYRKLYSAIQEMQTELDIINNTVTFEVPEYY